MLVDQKHTKIVTEDFVDGEALLRVYDITSRKEEKVPLGSNAMPHIWLGGGGHFGVKTGGLYSIRNLDNPEVSLCDIRFGRKRYSVKGDMSFLAFVPTLFTRKTPIFKRKSIYELVEFGQESRILQRTPLSWFNNQNFDTIYQSVIGAYRLPNGDILITLQRSEIMVLLDGESKEIKKNIKMDGYPGNAECYISRERGELWVVNYDVLLKLDLETLEKINTRQVQPIFTEEIAKRNKTPGPFMPGKMHGFMGRLIINEKDGYCIAPRPFMGDVQILDLDTMDVKYQAQVGENPYKAVFVNGRTIFAEDWNTDEILRVDIS